MTPFLQSRLDYLHGLPSIAPGWISCGSQTAGLAPSQNVCDLAAQFLCDSEAAGNEWSLQTLILGPLVSGGIELEIRSGQDRFFMIFHNDGPSEVSLLESGAWSSYELAAEQVVTQAEQWLNRVRALVPSAPRSSQASGINR